MYLHVGLEILERQRRKMKVYIFNCSRLFFREIVEFDGPPSWSLDASETGKSTKCPWVVAVRLKAWG